MHGLHWVGQNEAAFVHWHRVRTVFALFGGRIVHDPPLSAVCAPCLHEWMGR